MQQFSDQYIDYMINGLEIIPGKGTWRQKRADYWHAWWTRKRCLICCRTRPSLRGSRNWLELNHLRYDRLGDERLSDLRPACHTPCHPMITFVSRCFDRMAITNPSLKATYAVWFVARLPLIVLVFWLARL